MSSSVIRKVVLEGIGSFQKSTEFEVDRGGVLVLMRGHNGAGKSTLFSSIPWGLYGVYAKGLSSKKIVTWEEKQLPEFKGSRVMIYVTGIDGIDYVISRHISYKGKTFGVTGKNELLVFCFNPVANDYLQTEDRYKGDRQQTINSIMGMDGETFMQSFFFGQNLGRLINNSKEENQKLLERILEVSWVKKAKEVADSERSKLKSELNELSVKLDAKATSRLRVKEELISKQDMFDNFYENNESRLADAGKILSDYERVLKTTNEELTINKELSAKYDSKLVDDLYQAISDFKKDTGDIDKLERKIKETKESGIDTIYKEYRSVVNDKTAIESLLDPYSTEKRLLLDKLSPIEDSIKLNKKQLDDSEYRFNTLERSIKKYNTEIESINLEIDKLTRGIGNILHVCPTCSQDMPADQINNAKKAAQANIKKEQDALEALKATLLDIENKIVDELKITNNHKKINESLLKDQQVAQKAITKLTAKYSTDMKQAEDTYNENVKLALAVREKAESHLATTLAEDEKLLNKLDKAYDAGLADLEIRLSNAEADNKAYREAGAAIPHIEQKIKDTEGYIITAKKSLVSIENEKPPVSKEDITNTSKELAILGGEVNALEVEEDAKKQLLSKVDWWARTGFGSSGVKAFIFQSGLQRLNEYIRKYANRLGYRVTFSIDTDSTYKDFVTTVYYSDRRPDGSIVEFAKEYNEFSGGEKQRVALAISFAMEDFVADSADCNFICKDEIFGGLDEDGRNAAFDLLRLSAESGKSVFIITHDDLLDAKYTKTLWVRNSPEGSIITNN